jgi:hypothetical protein
MNSLQVVLENNIYEKFPPFLGNHACISKTTWKLFMGFGTGGVGGGLQENFWLGFHTEAGSCR